MTMIRKVAQIHRMDSCSEIRQNLEYWLSRPPEERLAAVDELRRGFYGDLPRLQRVARVVTLDESTASKATTGGGRDASDTSARGEQ